MKTTISLLALAASLGLATAGFAQEAPTGGPDAKGNAPLKNMHTVNDGSAKPGASSFTQNEARKHILHSGYTSVTGLMKGKDGVWRGTAMKGGSSVNVALDFKGNVTEGAPRAAAPIASAAPVATTTTTNGAAAVAPAPAMVKSSTIMHGHHHWRHHHMRHHRMLTKCGTPGPNGVACSGRDRNNDGIADKDEKTAH